MSGQYVYALVNQSLPGLVKIGMTSRNPFDRASELHTTGVPTPFVVLAAILVSDASRVERMIHENLSSHRVGDEREFFRITPSQAVESLWQSARETFTNSPSLEFSGLSPLEKGKDSLEEAELLLSPGPAYDIFQAKKLLEQADKSGNARASLLLGELYMKGALGKASKAKAYAAYVRAASRGILDANYTVWQIGKDYMREESIPYLMAYLSHISSAISLESLEVMEDLVDDEFAPEEALAIVKKYLLDVSPIPRYLIGQVSSYSNLGLALCEYIGESVSDEERILRVQNLIFEGSTGFWEDHSLLLESPYLDKAIREIDNRLWKKYKEHKKSYDSFWEVTPALVEKGRGKFASAVGYTKERMVVELKKSLDNSKRSYESYGWVFDEEWHTNRYMMTLCDEWDALCKEREDNNKNMNFAACELRMLYDFLDYSAVLGKPRYAPYKTRKKTVASSTWYINTPGYPKRNYEKYRTSNSSK